MNFLRGVELQLIELELEYDKLIATAYNKRAVAIKVAESGENVGDLLIAAQDDFEKQMYTLGEEHDAKRNQLRGQRELERKHVRQGMGVYD